MPTLLIYFNGDIVGQVVGLEPVGGESVTVEGSFVLIIIIYHLKMKILYLIQKDLEWALHKTKCIEGCELESDPRDRRTKFNIGYVDRARVGVAGRKAFDDNDSDESE